MHTSIGLAVREQGADAQALDELAALLRAELLAFDVDDVTRARSGEAPPGTRAIGVESIGALIVTLQGSVTLVESLVRGIRTWLNRGPSGRTVELTVGDVSLKLAAATAEQQDQLIEQFVRAATRA